MKFREKKNSIKTFDLNRYLSLIQNNSEFKLFSLALDLIKEVDLEENIQTIKEEEGGFILNDINGKGYRIKEFGLDKYEYYILLTDSNYLYGIKDNLCKVSLDDQALKWSSSHHSLINYWENDFFFTRTRKGKSADTINCVDCNDGKCLWSFNLGDIVEVGDKPYQVKKFIHLDRGNLWVALNNHTVIALEITTGKLKKQLSSISSFKCDWLPSAIPAPEAIQIDKRRNCLVGFMWEFYWEINLESTEIKLYDLTSYFQEQKIRNDKPDFVLGEKHIYFISQNESKLGALNLETKKIDWVYAFEANENGVVPEILELKGDDLLLGALDRNKTLHIFEKET